MAPAQSDQRPFLLATDLIRPATDALGCVVLESNVLGEGSKVKTHEFRLLFLHTL